MDKVAS